MVLGVTNSLRMLTSPDMHDPDSIYHDPNKAQDMEHYSKQEAMKRGKRALIPIMGKVLSYVFGVATSKEVNQLKSVIVDVHLNT